MTRLGNRVVADFTELPTIRKYTALERNVRSAAADRRAS